MNSPFISIADSKSDLITEQAGQIENMGSEPGHERGHRARNVGQVVMERRNDQNSDSDTAKTFAERVGETEKKRVPIRPKKRRAPLKQTLRLN